MSLAKKYHRTCIVKPSFDQSSLRGKLDRLDTALHGKDIFKYGNQLFDNPLLLHFWLLATWGSICFYRQPLFFVLIKEPLTIKRMLATWLPCTWASVLYGTHISVFASSFISTQSQSEPVSGGAMEQDSDISQRMSSPTPLSEPEIIVELRFLTVDDEHI